MRSPQTKAKRVTSAASPNWQHRPERDRHGLSAPDGKVVCVKLEDGGCLLVEGLRHVRIPTGEVEVVDTTGAGDAFTGALAVALLEGRSPEPAARFAVSASMLALTGYGSQPAYPRREAIEERLREESNQTWSKRRGLCFPEITGGWDLRKAAQIGPPSGRRLLVETSRYVLKVVVLAGEAEQNLHRRIRLLMSRLPTA